MNTLLIAATFLTLAVCSCSGHAIARLDQTKNENDVPLEDLYEVNDKPSSISFTYPRQKTPTLREIIYYHVVEKPYKDPNTPSDDGPDFDETVRPFTNSHGFQFLDPDLDQERQNNDQSAEEVSSNEDQKYAGETDTESVEEADKEYATTPEPEYEIVYVDEIDDENDKAPTTTEQQTDVIVNEESLEAEAIGEPEIDMVTEVETVTEKPLENKVKHTRKLLFDLVKEKYYGKSNEQNVTSSLLPQERQKRAISEIPEAPRLGELNLDSLPPYLRKMIAAGKPELKDDDADENLKVIEHKVRGLFEELETADDQDPKTRAPKTYGMNLTGDSGYIWNDMWSDPGISYNVEESHTEVATGAEQDSIEENIESEDEDDDDIEVHITKGDRRREPSTRMKSNDDVIDDMTPLHDDHPIEGRARKHEKHNHVDQEDTMKDLIQNDQFWEWLADWTSVYMDALSEHIKEQIKDEVAKQSATITTNTDKETKPDSDDKQKHVEIPKEIKDSEHEHADSRDSVTEKSEPEIKDDKLLLDGKEIPIVHNLEPNADEVKVEDSLKKHTDKDNKRNEDNNETLTDNVEEKQSPVNIEAKNLFGSTVGSEKVTNIFIFYPNKENNDIIADLQAANISEPTTYVIGKPNDTVDVTNAPNKDIEDKNYPTETTTIPAVIELTTEPLIDYSDIDKNVASTIITTASSNDQQVTTTTEETLVTEKTVTEDVKLNIASTSTPEINVRQSNEVKSESTRDEVSEEEISQATEVSNQESDNGNKKEESLIEKVETDAADLSKTKDNDSTKELKQKDSAVVNEV